MKFIAVLIVVGMQQLLPQLDDLRRFGWLRALRGTLADRFGTQSWWDGRGGVFIVLVLPALVSAFVVAGTGGAAGFLAGAALLLYSLGPRDLGSQVDRWLTGVAVADEPATQAAAVAITGDAPDAPAAPADRIAAAVLVGVNERLCTPLFWYVVLGAVGPAVAIVYRLSSELAREPGQPERFAAAARQLADLLAWAPARLIALGYALTGSLVHAFAAWRFSSTLGPADNAAVLERAGMGALQIEDAVQYCAADAGNGVVLVNEVRSLVGRTLVAWVTVYFALTIVALAS
ncbi:MAG: regulatory signaling modulator protein AmpE [Gammaproteobacteria bacterium]